MHFRIPGRGVFDFGKTGTGKWPKRSIGISAEKIIAQAEEIRNAFDEEKKEN